MVRRLTLQISNFSHGCAASKRIDELLQMARMAAQRRPDVAGSAARAPSYYSLVHPSFREQYLGVLVDLLTSGPCQRPRVTLILTIWMSRNCNTQMEQYRFMRAPVAAARSLASPAFTQLAMACKTKTSGQVHIGAMIWDLGAHSITFTRRQNGEHTRTWSL